MEGTSDSAGPSTPKLKRRKHRSKASLKSRDEPTAAPVDEMDIDPPIKASSSKLPLEKTGPRRKRNKNTSVLPTAPIPVLNPKDQAKVDKQLKKQAKLDKKERRRAEKVKEKTKGKRKDENAWDYVALAQDEASRIPPVWSMDCKFYFVVSNTSIHVHSSSAGFKRLSTLSSTHRRGHKGKITGLQIHPTNPLQLLSCAMDGTVKFWDWVEGRLIRTLEMTDRGSVGHMCTGQVGGKWYIFATAAIRKDGESKKNDSPLRHRIVRIPLAPPRKDEQAEPVRHLGKVSQPPSALFISPSHAYLVALAGNKAHTYRLPPSTDDEAWSATCVKFVSDQPFTCGQFSPASVIPQEEEWFATGDAKGVIRLWHGLSAAFQQVESVNGELGDSEKRLPTTSLHWHAHAVGALAFTPSGAQLLSAGEESVLVQWHLASGKREYIPRLGGQPIISLGVKQGAVGIDEEWWMGLADGGMIRVGAASGQVSTVGQGIRLDPLRPKAGNVYYPLATHPPTNSIVLPSSHPSTLQFVDPISSTVLFNLEVSPSNRVSRRDEKVLEPVAVEHVAFNDSRSDVEGDRWMITVEGRKGDEGQGGGAMRTLKFWKWIGDRYTINTQYPRPHDLDELVHISFSPSRPSDLNADPLVLTCAKDGTAKIWHVRQFKRTSEGELQANGIAPTPPSDEKTYITHFTGALKYHVDLYSAILNPRAPSTSLWSVEGSALTNISGKAGKKVPVVEKFWSCRNTFSYRDMPIHAAAFSPDSTIIALAHGTIISLWDTTSGGLLKTLSGALDVRQLAFVSREGRYLATAGNYTTLAIWDLLSCEVSWISAGLSTLCLVGLPETDTLAVVHSPDNNLYRSTISIFSPTSPVPLRQPYVRHKLNRIVVLPGSTQDSLEFIGTAFSGEVLRFGDDVSYSRARRGKVEKKDEKEVSIWQEMFGKEAFIDLDLISPASLPSEEVIKRKTGRPTEVFDGPSHTLPPPSLLFDSFIDRLLGTPIDSKPALRTQHEEPIIYESGLPDKSSTNAPETLVPETKGRKVTDQEIKEVQTLFQQILSLPGNNPPAERPMINGDSHPLEATPNGHVDVAMVDINGNAADSEDDTPGPPIDPKKLRKASRKVSTRKSPHKVSNGALSDAAETDHAVGKKRKAAPKS